MLATWLEWALLLALWCLVLVIFGWAIFAFWSAIFQFVFSWWDTDKIKTAWMSIRYMILGIIMTIAFLFIFPVIFQRIQLPNADIFTAQNIFSQSSEVVKFVLWFGSESIQIYQNNWWFGSAGWTSGGSYIAPTTPSGNLEL